MVDYNPLSPEVMADPYPYYKRLRDESPVHYIEAFDCWFLSRFEDIWQTLQKVKALSTTRGVTLDSLGVPGRPELGEAAMLAMLDPPEHTRLRSAVRHLFTPAFVGQLEASTRELADDCVVRIANAGGGDILGDLALRISVRVACKIIGIPLGDADALASQVVTFFQREPGVQGLTPEGLNAIGELSAYLVDLAASRAREGAPRDDALSVFARPEFGFEDAQVASHALMLLIGGTETLPKVFAAGVHRLWQHPEQRAELVARPDLIPTAFQEILRYDMPTQMLGRYLVEEVEVGGKTLKPGAGLLFLWPSANRDEREFPDPDRFDIHRDASRILSFGHGQHMCLGAHVARMEGRVMLETLLTHVPEYEVLEDQARFMPSEFLRGFESLPVRC
jgi:cytochrome P450